MKNKKFEGEVYSSDGTKIQLKCGVCKEEGSIFILGVEGYKGLCAKCAGLPPEPKLIYRPPTHSPQNCCVSLLQDSWKLEVYLKMEIVRYFEPKKESALKCIFSVHLPKAFMTLHNCKFFSSGEKEWVTLPSESFDKEGETKYFEQVQIDAEYKEEFKKKLTRVIKEYRQKQIKMEDDLFASTNEEKVPF